jgi:DNA-binding transcriptional ArsR family regulator
MAYEYVLTALADPTRRVILERLLRRPHTVGELAELAGVRQPTISQHLQVMREAKLVTDRRDGTRRFYQADREGLAQLRAYLESLWDDVLTAYATQDEPAKRKTATARSARRTNSRRPR